MINKERIFSKWVISKKLINDELYITESVLFKEDFPTDLEYPYDGELERFGKKIITKGNEMEIYYQFGKNGGGITKELAVIGQELEKLSNEGWWLVLEDPHFDNTDDVYDIKVFGRKEEDGINESVLDTVKDKLININDKYEFKKNAKILLSKGITKNVIIGLLSGMMAMTTIDDMKLRTMLDSAEKELEQAKKELTYNHLKEKAESDWKLVSTDAIATVYNAHPSQCNSNCYITASGFKLDKNNINAHRIIAMERTFMKELGVKYGDVVKIEGTGKYDGVWQIQDTMNKRFDGQHKIDILTTNKYGKWDGVNIYKLSHPDEYTEFFRNKLLSSK